VNKELADAFGNLVNRVVTHQAFDGCIPAAAKPGEPEISLSVELGHRLAALKSSHEALEFRRSAAETRGIWGLANAHLQHTAPWTAVKSDPTRAALVTRTGLNLVRLFAAIAWSIIPSLSQDRPPRLRRRRSPSALASRTLWASVGWRRRSASGASSAAR
jgi:methionyl-tRNA synthetase